MINIDVPDMLSDKEAAKLFGLPQKLICAKARNGEIVAIQYEGNYFVKLKDMDK
ncbi:MAG: helix-turn-helix domain-containing protein [Eubacterium sp.]|nr:helix-turn-helix domain-containing protein [Eubacterium sp.]